MRMKIFIFGALFANFHCSFAVESEAVNVPAKDTPKVEATPEAKDDFARKTAVRLSSRYVQGNVLVYDCKDRHFVCTDMINATECHDARLEAIEKNRFNLPCAPVKHFKDTDECVEEHYKRMHQIPDTTWCYSEKKLRF